MSLPTLSTGAAGAASTPARRYPYSEAFFQEAIRDAVRESLFSPVALGERHDVKLKKKFETACWAYLPPHRIYIGTELFEKPNVKRGLTPAQQAKYIANHYHHELGHALFTERDMKRIQAALKVIDAPFQTYNLFEDAYMEHRYRIEAEYRFEWLTLEDLLFSPRPESLLFALIQAEGDVKVVQTALNAWVPPALPGTKATTEDLFELALPGEAESSKDKLLKWFPKVLCYFEEIIAVKESLKLMPILKRWLDEFGRTEQGANPLGGMAGGGELEISFQLMTDEEAAEKFDDEAETVNPSGDSDADEGGGSRKLEADKNHQAIAAKGKVLHHTRTPISAARVVAAANKLRKFFEESSRVVSTRTPQKRVSARHFALDRAPYRKKEKMGRGTKRVVIVVDCSGSMRGFHIQEGKIIVAALSQLAQLGHVEGHVILSAVNMGPNFETFTLPMSTTTIEHIAGFAGGEGLEYAMHGNLALLREADYVFVYTDGQIGDKAIDKSGLHRYGVYTWGLYAGPDDSYLDSLLEYFDKALLRKDAESLIDAMLIQQK